MASLTINGSTYTFPDSGTNPNWGKEATEAIQAIVSVLNTISAADDVLTTSVSIANNQSSASNITGLSFDTASVRSAIVRYSIYRKTDSATSGNAENGYIFLVYDTNASSGNKWTLSQTVNGSASVAFSVTDAGQVQYISSNIAGANYTGTIKFNAITFAQ